MAGLVATSDYESLLKILEDETTNAHEIQEKLLEDILKRNGGTEYLSTFLNGQTDKKLFKKNVPIVSYEDIKPYIDRLANGESSDFLSAESITGFFSSSGTSGGQTKLIPSSPKRLDEFVLFLTLAAAVSKKHFNYLDHGKRLHFLFARQEIKTPSGLIAESVTTRYFKTDIFKKTLSEMHTTPMETVLCPDPKQGMYCQLLVGLVNRDEVVSIGSVFASAVVRAIKFLEDHWKEMCFNIKTGRISDWITDSSCRNAVSLVLKIDPKSADSIESICCSESWEGIIRLLWPKARLIEVIATGSMSQYNTLIDFYSKGLPIFSAIYGSSEAFCGINLEALSKPCDVTYTFLPNMAYYEFIPVNKHCVGLLEGVQFNGIPGQENSIEMEIKGEDIEPVDLVNVKPGQCYELVVTTSIGLCRYRVGDIVMATGFHNNAPQFRFIERKNSILSIDTEKTSEAELFKAVTEAKALMDPIGLLLTGFTSYADTSSIPGHYVVFWELKTKEGNDMEEPNPEIMVQCCCAIEGSLSYIYKNFRDDNKIAPLEIRVVKHGTFDALMEYYVSQGASMSQYKAPSCIISKVALKILDSRVIGRFFSTQNPC